MRAALVLLFTAGVAWGRSAVTITTQADLAHGTATKLAAAQLPAAKLTSPRGAPASTAAYDRQGTVTITTNGKLVVALHVGKLPYEWMPWSIAQPGVLVFDWRERIQHGQQPDTYRDVLRGIDLATGAELWRRETPGASAAAIGDQLILVSSREGSMDLVDSRHGTTVRVIALRGHGPTGVPIDGGDTLVDTGETLARFDAKGAIRWQIDDLSSVRALTPVMQPDARFQLDGFGPVAALPATGDWLVLAVAHLARIDAATGKVVWMQPSTSTSLLVDAGRLLVTDIQLDAKLAATVKLVVRDLATGATTRELELFRYREFFDKATATLLAVRGDVVEISTLFIVLD